MPQPYSSRSLLPCRRLSEMLATRVTRYEGGSRVASPFSSGWGWARPPQPQPPPHPTPRELSSATGICAVVVVSATRSGAAPTGYDGGTTGHVVVREGGGLRWAYNGGSVRRRQRPTWVEPAVTAVDGAGGSGGWWKAQGRWSRLVRRRPWMTDGCGWLWLAGADCGRLERVGNGRFGKMVVLLFDGDVGLTPPWWWGRGLSSSCWWCRGSVSGCVGLFLFEVSWL